MLTITRVISMLLHTWVQGGECNNNDIIQVHGLQQVKIKSWAMTKQQWQELKLDLNLLPVHSHALGHLSVWRFNFLATRENCILSIYCSERWCNKRYNLYLHQSWYSGVGWCTREPVATVVQDRTMKLQAMELLCKGLKVFCRIQ